MVRGPIPPFLAIMRCEANCESGPFCSLSYFFGGIGFCHLRANLNIVYLSFPANIAMGKSNSRMTETRVWMSWRQATFLAEKAPMFTSSSQNQQTGLPNSGGCATRAVAGATLLASPKGVGK